MGGIARARGNAATERGFYPVVFILASDPGCMDHRVELHNLKDDMGEMNDFTAKMPDKASALRRMLHDWRKNVVATAPTPKPE